MKKFSYSKPVKATPPSPISQLGRIVRAMSPGILLTSREIYSLAFSQYESFECCRAVLMVAKARSYVDKIPADRVRGKYQLTAIGSRVRDDIIAWAGRG